MIRFPRALTLFLAASLAVLSACGGGGSSGGAASAPAAGTSATVVSSGAITGFGSVHLNGEHFLTTATVFNINGHSGTQGDLRVGHFITVHGHRDNAGNSVADRIDFDDLIKGPVTSIDATASTLLVLGQTIVVDADTSFDDSIPGAALSGLTAGDIVEVSGTRRADGAVQATRIELKPAGTAFEVTGIAASVDTATHRFNINTLVVDYTSAAVDEFTGGQPKNGDLIEVTGTTVTAGVLIATRIERKRTDDGAAAGDRAEAEGLVTRFVSATDFDVAGKAVTTNASTIYVGGTAADLALNVKVEVEGSIDANGVIVASKVQLKRDGTARIAARVDSVNVAANTLVVLGIDISVNASTRVEDKGDQRVAMFNLSNLAAGDWVEIRGAESPAGSNDVVATRLERRKADNDVRLRGIVDSVTGTTISILGVTVETNGSTQFDGSATLDALVGKTVSVKGTVTNGVLTVREVEFEDD